MLVKDTPVLKRHQYMKRVENTRGLALQGSQREAAHTKLVEDKHTSVANPEVQMGRRLTATQFMNKLRTINKDIVMEPHPAVNAPKESAFYKLNHDKAVLNLVIGDKKIYLLVCEGDYMPEWETMNTQTIKTPIDDPAGPWKQTQAPWHIVKRGWRTVLIRLIHKHLISVEDAERVFGVGNRESWKILTGKGFGQLPY